MELKFEQKKTTELSKEEFEQIVSLFKVVFKRDITVEALRHSYMSTPLAYSYHSIMKDEDVICGFNTFEPSYFIYHGRKVLVASSVTTMVDVKHRGASNFYHIISKAYPYLKTEGVSLVYAYPNNNSYPVFTKMKLTKDVGEMFTYCLPLRIGGIKPKFKIINFASLFFCRCWVFISNLFISKDVVSFPMEKDVDTYDGPRYSRNLNDVYKKVMINKAVMHYRIKEYEGIRTAFLIDLSKKSSRNFVDAVKYIIRTV